jgi:tetratricopeptide (TPR) repeat protein
VVPLADLLMEHRTYLASLGIFLAVVAGGDRWLARRGVRPAVGAALLAAACAVLAVATWQRNAVWETRLAQAQDAVAKSPRKARPHASLGHALAERGRHDEALREFATALAMVGDSPVQEGMVLRDQAASLAALGRWEEAGQALRRGLARDPGSADLNLNLAIVLAREGDLAGAERHARRALELRPGDPTALHQLGLARLQAGDAAEASAILARAVAAAPDDGVRRFNLGLALRETGRLPEACAAWREVAARPGPPALRDRAGAEMAEAGCPGAEAPGAPR